MSPQTATPPRTQPPMPTWLRGLCAVLATAASLPAAAFCAFWASVAASGCFMSCDPSSVDRLEASLWALGAAALLCLGPLTAAVLGRSRAWAVGTAWALLGLSVTALLAVAST